MLRITLRYVKNYSPLLFLIYINDLPASLNHAKPRMFADDTNLTFKAETVRELEHQVNHDLENINQWLIANKLFVNMTKTEYMIIASDNRFSNMIENPNFYIGNETINRVSILRPWVYTSMRNFLGQNI